MTTKQIEVQIMGQSYLLGCPEGGESRLQAAVDKVDAAMCKIRDAGKIKARDRIAVLAALNVAFEHNELSSATAPASSPTQTAGPRLAQLIERLDQAVRLDGRLL
ncbi:MAG: cell division protein ZapA [Limnohabitans sp.]